MCAELWLALGPAPPAPPARAAACARRAALCRGAQWGDAGREREGDRANHHARAQTSHSPSHHFTPLPSFAPRHNSATPAEIDAMVAAMGYPSLDALIDATVPASIRADKPLDLGAYTPGMTESEFLDKFK